MQAILNILLLVGVNKVLLFKSNFIIACCQLHFPFTRYTLTELCLSACLFLKLDMPAESYGHSCVLMEHKATVCAVSKVC